MKYNRETVAAILESGAAIPEDGIEDAFEVLHEIPERYDSCLPAAFIAYSNHTVYTIEFVQLAGWAIASCIPHHKMF